MKKFYLNLKLLLLLMFSVISLNINAHDFEALNAYGKSIFYRIISETNLTVSVTYRGNSSNSYHNEYNGDIIIPSTIEYEGNIYRVTEIDDYAFMECSGLTSVTIGNSVTTIGNNAFDKCTGLKELIIKDGEGTLSLGRHSSEKGLFYDCPLETLYLGRDLSYNTSEYYASPFYNKTKLTSVTIGNSVTTICEWAFYGCTGIKKVYITDLKAWCNIEFGGSSANPLDHYYAKLYLNNELITDLVIPEGITSIGDYAFYGCSGLTSVTIGNSVTTIGDYAFYECSGLTSVTIGNSVTTIGYKAFNATIWYYNQPDVIYINSILYAYKGTMPENTSIEVKQGTKSIHANAFSGCSGLTSITIPNSVTTIGASAFSGCSGLTSITIPNSVTTIGASAFSGCSGLTSITIPNSVTTIDKFTFYGCDGLTSVSIGNSVTTIDKYAFYDCDGLTSITIPNSVTTICEDAFRGCSGLTSVTIGNSVTSIENSTFEDCSGLTSITIPNSVTTIGEDAFRGCSGLTSITIPNSVTTIGEDAFRGCSGLTSITIPNSVTSIENYTFYGCSGLTSITIPNSVTTICEDAFYRCFGLKELIIEDGEDVLSLGCDQFDACPLETLYLGRDLSYNTSPYECLPFYGKTKLSSVTIGNSVTTVGDYAFYDCYGLTSVTIGNSVTTIGDYAFYRCSSLTSITIPNSVTSIGASAFYDCDALTSITIPNSVTTICASAFFDCEGLTSVTIGNSVTTIGYHAFYWCSSLKEIISMNTTPPSLDEFSFSDYYSAYIYVPKGCVDKYISASYWSNFRQEGYSNIYHIYSIPSNNAEGIRYSLLCGNTAYVAKADTSITKANILSSVTIGGVECDVVKIGASAFKDCKQLKTLLIPNSIKTIEDSAFYNCDALTNIIIPNSVTDIESLAFANNDLLSVVRIGKNVSTIGWGAFNSCPKIQTFDILADNNYFIYENGALLGKDKTQFISLIKHQNDSYTIPEGIKSISPFALSGCTTLKTVIIGENVNTIGRNAFSNCTNLTTVQFNPINCKIMGSEKYPVFYNCNSLNKIIIGDKVSLIPANAFRGCSGLTSITIPNSVTTIGVSAFEYCSGLTSLIIPNSVTSIADNAFYGCSGLQEIRSKKQSPAPYIQGGGTFTGVSKSIPVYIPEATYSTYSTQYGWKDFTNFREVYDKSTYINGITYGLSKDNVVVVANADEDIVDVKIENIVEFDGIEYPVTTIIENSFSMSKQIETLIIGDNIKSIPNRTFENNTKLRWIVIGSSVTSIGDNVFYGCSGLQEIRSKKQSPAPYIQGGGTFTGVSKSIPLYIPEGTYSTYSTQYGWKDFTNIREVYDKTTYINGITYALNKDNVVVVYMADSDIKNVEIASSVEFDGIEYPVTTIIENSFSMSKQIETLIIGDNIKSIPDRTFENNTKLRWIVIGVSVTSIGDNAFYNCTSLEEINSGKAGTAPYIQGGGTFTGVSKSIPVYIPEGSLTSYSTQYGWKDFSIFKEANYKTKEIDGIKYRVSIDDSYAFVERADASITEAPIKDNITILNKTYPVTEINDMVFTLCSDLSSVIIPSYLTKIGEQAFYGCTDVEAIYSLNSTPPACELYAFYGIDLSIPVYVPKGSTAAYSSAEEWKYFFNFVESDFVGVEEEQISTTDIKVIAGNGVEINDYYGNLRIVNLSGQVVKDIYVNGYAQITLPKGVYIVVTNNKSQKVVL